MSDRKIKIKALKKDCKNLFGVSSSTFDAVANGLDENEYTTTEMKSHITKWLEKEAK